MKVYLVGGAVRDELLGFPVHDRDWLVVGGTQDYFLENGYQQVGKDFPVFLHPESKEEYALARIERKNGTGYHGFDCYFGNDVTVEDDLLRRDLTINAIAKDINGNYIDPFGGINDLKNKKLKHVSESFKEDPLRILRVARFYARYYHLGFTVHDDTKEMLKSMVKNGEMDNLVPERVYLEIRKAFTEPDPDQFFYMLHEIGALKRFLPELDYLYGVPQRHEHHPEIDCFVHTMLSLKMAQKISNSDADVMFAVLLHDLGKGFTPLDVLPKHLLHEKNGKPHVENVCNRLKVPKETKELAMKVCEYHLIGHNIMDLSIKKLKEYFVEHLGIKKQNSLILEKFAMACKADALGRTGYEANEYPQYDFMLKIKEEFLKKKIDSQSVIASFNVLVEKGKLSKKDFPEYMKKASATFELNVLHQINVLYNVKIVEKSISRFKNFLLEDPEVEFGDYQQESVNITSYSINQFFDYYRLYNDNEVLRCIVEYIKSKNFEPNSIIIEYLDNDKPNKLFFEENFPQLKKNNRLKM